MHLLANMIEHVQSAGDFVKYVILKIIVFLTYIISHIYDYVTYPFYFIYYHPWLVRQYKREGNNNLFIFYKKNQAIWRKISIWNE